MQILEFETGDKLYESDRSVIYRTTPRDGQPRSVLKVFKGGPLSAPRLARIRRELELGRQVQSAHVITVHRIEAHHGTLVGVLEDFAGESLAACIGRDRPALADALRLSLSLCRGVADIHDAGIVHKDICAANVLWNQSTGTSKLIDFGTATRLERAAAAPAAPRVLEGTLPYMSPEQTGRMNRPVDFRTDLYSLGVTLYELFTGKRPFDSDDPLEIIHGHIARQPLAPSSHDAAVPEAISSIILKLLQKNAEDRYQSAEGVRDDLIECIKQLEARGSIRPFPLAAHDVRGRFRIPAQLYGREQDVAVLAGAFRSVVAGGLALTLVTGHSGVGKSSLVQELYRPLAVVRGRYLAGKYDQYQRSIPYAAVGRAFDSLCDQLLCEPPEVLRGWRERILHGVGRNGRALIKVIPHLEEIIGAQPPLPEQSAQSAQNVFHQVCQDFVASICRPEEPLVLFLDDLQWADLASLDLLRTVLKHSGIRGLHVVGAYRDNEVDASHPLRLLLAEAEQAGIAMATVHLDNLTLANVTAIAADTLATEHGETVALARVIHAKTEGNAFFTTEFLKALHAEALLTFDRAQRRWRWDVAAINARQITDNVVELMADRLRLLPEATQHLLRLAACIGNAFDVRTLAIISHGSERMSLVLEALAPAVELGVIVSVDDGERFKFQHDRVQQAAYSLIPDLERQRVHKEIARQLINDATVEQRLFEIVGHLKKAAALVTEDDEKLRAAQLSLRAGVKARKASAHHASLEHFRLARDFLPASSFDTELAFEIQLALAKACSIAGQFAEADAIYPILLAGDARTVAEQVRVHTVQMDDHHLRGDYHGAIEVQTRALALLGEEVPSSTAALAGAIDAELTRSAQWLGGRSIAALVDAKEIEAPLIDATMKTLMSLWMIAYLVSREDLVHWSSIRLANLSLQHGNSEQAAFAYVQYGYLCVARLQRFEEGYQYGRVALQLADRYDNLEMRGKIYFLFGLFISHWTRHISLATEAMRKGYLYSVDAGDWTYAVYGAANVVSNLIIAGVPCDEVAAEAEHYLQFLRDKATVGLNSFFLPGGYCALLNLQGKTSAPDSFNCAFLDEERFHESLGHLPIVEAWFYAVKIRSLYLHRCFDAGVRVIAKAEVVAEGVPAQVKVPEACFYSCLMLAAAPQFLEEVERARCWALFAKCEQQLKSWGEQCPENHLHKYCLVVAERTRVQGGTVDEVLAWYARAIEAAVAGQHPHIAALAHELRGRYWLHRNYRRYAVVDLREAHAGYQRWGAATKVTLLEAEFAELAELALGAPSEAGYRAGELDLLAAQKAQSAIAGKLELPELIETMMRIVMESAGAERGLLLRDRDDHWQIEAEAIVDDSGVRVRPRSDAAGAPLSLVHFAVRTQAALTVDDPAGDLRFGQDPYIVAVQPRSTSCVPLIHQGRTIGALYLENRHAAGVFTAERRDLLDVLTGQMAVSLENASLYADLKATVAEQTRMMAELQHTNTALAQQREQLSSQAVALGALHAEVAEASRLKSEFLANMSHELRTPLNSVIGFAELLHDGEVGAVAPQQKEFLGDILTSGQHLLQMINDVLDLAKVEAGKLSFFPEPIDLATVVAASVSSVRPLAAGKDIRVAWSVSPELGTIELDAARLKQVLYNYLSNALKFSSQGGSVTVRVVPEGAESLRIEVEDAGVGIAPGDIGRLFQQFEQLDASAGKRHDGTGLGLVLTKRLVDAQGGSVGARSVLGQGSVFHAILPRRAGGRSAADAAHAHVGGAPRALQGHEPILIIDDNLAIAKLVSFLLVNHGYQIRCASGAAEAVAVLRTFHPRLILMDLQMAGTDGFALTRQLKADPATSDIVIIAVTAYAMKGDEQRARAAGCDDYVTKPIDTRALPALIAAHLAGAKGDA